MWQDNEVILYVILLLLLFKACQHKLALNTKRKYNGYNSVSFDHHGVSKDRIPMLNSYPHALEQECCFLESPVTTNFQHWLNNFSSQVVYLYGSNSWIKTCNNTRSIKLELKASSFASPASFALHVSMTRGQKMYVLAKMAYFVTFCCAASSVATSQVVQLRFAICWHCVRL